MQAKLNLDHQTRAVAMATGCAVVAAIVAMFVPTGIWETLTGSTGFSELVPATAAPLGDTARALISFGFGALTLAILTVLFLRKAVAPRRTAIAQAEIEPVWIDPATVEADIDAETETAEMDLDAEANEGSLLSRLRGRISAFAEARRSAGDITELEDLPKLRAGDAHPDAPARRPFSANRDLGEFAEAAEAVEAVVTPIEVEAEWAEPAEEVVEAEESATEIDAVAEAAVVGALMEEPIEPSATDAPTRAPMTEIGSLDEMVNRFESALAERDTQLAHIESLANELQASNVQPIRPDMDAPLAVEPVAAEQAPLRAVETIVDPVDIPQKPESEELDAALRSALETLHRMNARTR